MPRNEAFQSLPLPFSDPRYPGLRLQPARDGAKKSDVDYKESIVSDDSQFDIFDLPNTPIDDSQIQMHDVEPFPSYTEGVAFLDCEWIGPDGGEATGTKKDVLVAIGIKNRGYYYIGCNKDRTEKELLIWTFYVLDTLKIHTIAGYALYGFYRGDEQVMVDLAMIYYRAKHHGIKDIYSLGRELDPNNEYDVACMWRPKKGRFTKYKWQNAIVFGRALEAPAWECDKFELIDIYPQIVSYDALVRKLNSYSLKEAVIGFGLREDKRIDIGSKIYEYWERGDTETITEYLQFDLDDTELLWNFLLPQKYFQKTYMPMSLERVTTTGTGSWWHQFLKYKTGQNPDKTETASYQGALTYYHAGVYRNCAKFDYSGLYPSIMLTWLIASNKDENLESLRTLNFLLKYRKEIKRSEAFKNGDVDADGRQLTAKILANSLYGLWNTRGLGFNDPYAGAAITAYGRNLARYLITWLDERGVKTIALDTDGCAVYFENDNYTTEERDLAFRKLEQELNDALPGVTKIEYEEVIPFMFIPPNLKGGKHADKELADKLNTIDCYDVSEGEVNAGLSKNYIYFEQKRDNSKKLIDKYKLIKKGKYKKRDKSWLASDFPIEVISKLFYEGEESATEYAKQIKCEIESGSLPVDKLQKTVLVAANWKEFPEYGFPIGSKPTIHYIWNGGYESTRTMNKTFIPSDDPTKPYAPEYYLAQFDEIMEELPVTLPKDIDQMSLF